MAKREFQLIEIFFNLFFETLFEILHMLIFCFLLMFFSFADDPYFHFLFFLGVGWDYPYIKCLPIFLFVFFVRIMMDCFIIFSLL